jgi:hypothetical protein
MRKTILTLVCALTAVGCATTSRTRKWTDVQKDIATVEATATADPVSAYLTYKEALASPIACSREQRQSLVARMSELEPISSSRLQADRQDAAHRKDTRAATLIALIQALASTNVSPVLLEAQATVRPSTPDDAGDSYIWRVSVESAANVGGSYTDGQIRVSAPGGSSLVHASARIANISDVSDVPYMKWSFSRTKRVFAEWSVGDTTKGRWLDNSHIDLAHDGQVAPCVYVGTGSRIPGGSMRLTSLAEKGSVIPLFQPAYIPKGEAARLDLLFIVPEGVSTAELRVLGGKPVSATIGRAGK